MNKHKLMMVGIIGHSEHMETLHRLILEEHMLIGQYIEIISPEDARERYGTETKRVEHLIENICTIKPYDVSEITPIVDISHPQNTEQWYNQFNKKRKKGRNKRY